MYRSRKHANLLIVLVANLAGVDPGVFEGTKRRGLS